MTAPTANTATGNTATGGTVAVRTSRYVEHVMGLPFSLALRGRHAGDDAGREAWQHALAVLRDADRVFSPYRPDSLVRRVDRGEVSLAEAARDADVAEVLDLAARAGRATGGAFSVHRPRTDGSAAFDPSGVVKGWAAERAIAALRALDDTDFCLSAGGDVVGRAAETAWRIGIEDPHDPGRIVAVVPVRDGAVATSGTAHRGAHLVDARTGFAPTGVASVTVIARSLTVADVDATAAYTLGPDAADWLRHRVGRTGLVVHPDGSTTVVHPDGRATRTDPAG